jgi:hypothetical protein
VSLDARAYAKLMPRIGKVLEHALSSLRWAEASSSSSSSSLATGGPGGIGIGGGGGVGIGGDATSLMDEARRAFEATGDRAQDMIFELLRDKADELAPTFEPNASWEPTVPPPIRGGGVGGVGGGSSSSGSGAGGGWVGMCSARPEVEDLVAYLRVTFMCLTYLPSSIREAVHFASCSHIHSTLRGNLLDDLKRVNVYALLQLRCDVACLEEFADEVGGWVGGGSGASFALLVVVVVVVVVAQFAHTTYCSSCL